MLPCRKTTSAVLAVVAVAVIAGCTASSPDSAPSITTAPATTAPASTAPASTAPASTSAETRAAFTALEAKYGARLGVSAVATDSGTSVAFRATERFAFASTYKALAAGILLRNATDAQLGTTIRYTSGDLVDYSPVTEKHVESGMTLREVIAAALRYSDNTAANLMLDELGGPSGLTRSLRAIGDGATRVDRPEPGVNTAIPKDPRDTTTPRAIAADLRSFVLGDVLSTPRRAELRALMLGNTTGAPWIRAGVPSTWKVADKTGNASYGTRNDIAVVYPPGGAPIVIALLSDRGAADASSDDALLADATRVVVDALG